jgi:hypothetical protein
MERQSEGARGNLFFSLKDWQMAPRKTPWRKSVVGKRTGTLLVLAAGWALSTFGFIGLGLGREA